MTYRDPEDTISRFVLALAWQEVAKIWRVYYSYLLELREWGLVMEEVMKGSKTHVLGAIISVQG